MKAIQISAPGSDFELVNRDIPEPNAGELLIKVQACGRRRFPGHPQPRLRDGKYVVDGEFPRDRRSYRKLVVWKESGNRNCEAAQSLGQLFHSV
jgi:hypothetical protein